MMRGANAELVYHERQCWYSDYTIFGCQREFRLHTLVGLGASGARTNSPMAFKLHISPTDPLMWCLTGFHTHPMTLRSLLGTIPLYSQCGHCRTTTRRKIIVKIYWINTHKWQTIAYKSSIKLLKCSVRCLKQKYCNWKYKFFFTLCILVTKFFFYCI